MYYQSSFSSKEPLLPFLSSHKTVPRNSPNPESLHREAARLLDGLRQFVEQHLVRLVRRYVDPVEAGVRLGQVLGRRVHAVDGEEAGARRPRVALQRPEALQRHPRAASDELQEAGAHLLRVGVDGAPEPLDDGRVGRAVLQSGVRPVSGGENVQ